MQKYYTYPAIFTPYDGSGFTVVFPDVVGCITEGDTMQEAMAMAEDALSLVLSYRLEQGEPLPAPSAVETLQNTLNKGEIIHLVTAES